MLSRAGYEVISASDGLEAIKSAVSVGIDLVVTDAVMPNLDGNELCRFFRSSPRLSHIPIVLFSALERREDLEADAIDGFLSKPVSPGDLLKCISALLVG